MFWKRRMALAGYKDTFALMVTLAYASTATHVNSPGTATTAKEPTVMIWTSTIAGCHGRGSFICREKHVNMSYFLLHSLHILSLRPCWLILDLILILKNKRLCFSSDLSCAHENRFGLMTSFGFIGRGSKKHVSNAIPERVSIRIPCSR